MSVSDIKRLMLKWSLPRVKSISSLQSVQWKELKIISSKKKIEVKTDDEKRKHIPLAPSPPLVLTNPAAPNQVQGQPACSSGSTDSGTFYILL